MGGYYTRSFPVERTSGGVAQGFSHYAANGLGPHVPTIRWTYTVPSAKAAMIDGLSVNLLRVAVAAPAAFAQVLVYGTGGVYWADVSAQDNAIGSGRFLVAGLVGYARAGEAISSQTFDGSTGGAYNYSASLRYHEFGI